MLPEQPHGAAAGGAQKPSKGGCSAARGSRNFCLERVLGERSFAERKEGAAPCSLVHAVGGGHHPVPLDEGASAGVVPAAAGVILEGDLGRGRGRGRGLSAQGPGARRAPGSPVGPRQDSPGRARRASAPRSHRPPAASHRDPARSSALGTEGRREPPARGARGGCQEVRRPKAPGGTSPQRARAARSTSCSIILERGVHGGTEALLRGRFNGAAGGGAGREPGAAGPASGLGPAAKAHRAPRPRHPRATPSVSRLRIPGRRRPAPPPSRSRAPERCPEVVPVSAPGGLGCSSPRP